MNIRQPVAVFALVIALGLSGAQFASAHGGHGHGGVHGGDHHAPHNDRSELQTPIHPDGKGGAYHVDGNKVRHCRPADGAEHSLSCTDWK